MFKKSVSVILILCFIVYLVGCTTTRQITRQELKDQGKARSVWITTDDGKKFEVTDAEIEGNKLTGYVRGEGYKEIDLSQVEWLETKEVDKKKAIKWVAIGVTGAIVLVWLTGGDSGEEPCST
jgi:hypothetical protein